jgi:hypothetical protein
MSISTFSFPAYGVEKLKKAQELYYIRPYHYSDKEIVTEIFKNGMYEYFHQTNVRKPFPSLDESHQSLLTSFEPLWAAGFSGYVAYSSADPNLADIENYWSLTRRSIFLVAVEKRTDLVVGTVAIQPGTFLPECRYFSPYKYGLQDDIECNGGQNGAQSDDNNTKSPSTNSSPTSCPIDTGCAKRSYIKSLCNYAMGSLPAELYRLDDPMYDGVSFQPLMTVIPPLHNNNSRQDSVSFTPPRNPKDAQCQCAVGGKCRSKQTAIRISKLGKGEFKKYAGTVRVDDGSDVFGNDQNNDGKNLTELFCPCILNADSIVNNMITKHHCLNYKEILPCQYCISDSQYLIQPFIQNGDQIDQTTSQISPQYQLNPVLRTYNNIFTSSNSLKLETDPDNQKNSNLNLTLTQRLPFYTIAPNGYFRRFQYKNTLEYDQSGGAEVSQTVEKKSMFSSEMGHNAKLSSKFPTPLPKTITPSTYLDFLINHQAYNGENIVGKKFMGTEQNVEQNIELTNATEADKILTETSMVAEAEKSDDGVAVESPGDKHFTREELESYYIHHLDITPSLQENTPFIKATQNQGEKLIIHPKNNHNNRNNRNNDNKNIDKNNAQTENIPVIHLPFGDVCEFRRMSVEKSHRSSGVAYLLVCAALQTAFEVFKFKSLHLSTSFVMDMACQFYRKVGFRECIMHMEAMEADRCIPLAHFTFSFVGNDVKGFFFERKLANGESEQNGERIQRYLVKYSNTNKVEEFYQAFPWFDSFFTNEMQSNNKLQRIATHIETQQVQK